MLLICYSQILVRHLTSKNLRVAQNTEDEDSGEEEKLQRKLSLKPSNNTGMLTARSSLREERARSYRQLSTRYDLSS